MVLVDHRIADARPDPLSADGFGRLRPSFGDQRPKLRDRARAVDADLEWVADPDTDVILSTGGTGFAQRDTGELSATQEVNREYGLPVTAIATLADILATLRGRPEERANVERIEDYRRRYGVA